MKEFINKLIGRLEELRDRYQDKYGFCSDSVDYGKTIGLNDAISIVNQLAEEYINTSTDTSTDTSSDTSTDTSTTNADRIRSMTDEELAEFLYDTNHYFENNEYLVRFGSEIVQDEEINILDWLKSEVEGVTENE